MISRWGFESLTTLYAAKNDYESALFAAHQGLAEAEFRRDRWIPEMRDQLRAAQQGEDNALRIVAKGLGELTGVATDVVLEDGIDMDESQRLADALDVELALQRKAWTSAKSEKDKLLSQLSWTDPATLVAVKSSQHNTVLSDWVTANGTLDAGFALENHRILNTRDALYSLEGHTFYAATIQLGGQTWAKHHWNAMILWGATLAIVALLTMLGNGVRRRDQPR